MAATLTDKHLAQAAILGASYRRFDTAIPPKTIVHDKIVSRGALGWYDTVALFDAFVKAWNAGDAAAAG